MVYAKFGGQTECIMGNWKIENCWSSIFDPIILIFERNICISDLLTILVWDMCYHARKINSFQVSTNSCMLRIEKLIIFNSTCMWTLYTNSFLQEY